MTFRQLAVATVACFSLGFCFSAANADDASHDSPSTASDAEVAGKLIGSWRIIAAHREGVPSKVHYSAVTIKHITPTQFTWLSYHPDDRQIFRSMGGSWVVRDGMYVETPRYGMHDNFRGSRFGNSVAIKVDFDGDILTQTITSPSGSDFIEVWQRMAPQEDADAAPKLEE